MTPLRGEVWLVDFNPTVGNEIRKKRPAVVMSRDALGILDLRVVIPLTGWQPKFANWLWQVRLDPSPANGLVKLSSADTFQVRSVSVRRFVQRLGTLSDAEVARVAAGIKAVFDL